MSRVWQIALMFNTAKYVHDVTTLNTKSPPDAYIVVTGAPHVVLTKTRSAACDNYRIQEGS